MSGASLAAYARGMARPVVSLGLAPAVVGAALALQSSAVLPARGWLAAAVLAGFACLALTLAHFIQVARHRRFPAARHDEVMELLLLVGLACVAWAWSGWLAHQRIDDRLRPHDEGELRWVVGVVDELAVLQARGRGFGFRLEGCGPDPIPIGDPACRLPRRIQLSWSTGFDRESFAAVPAVLPGQRWRLAVVLRRPYAPINPQAFDRELRRLQEGIGATGSVRQGVLLDDWAGGPMDALERHRDTVRAAMMRTTPAGRDREAGVLVALAIGDQAAIAQPLWRVFNLTGVSHLMSISGLHITMLAGMAGTLAGWLWRRRLAGRLGLAERVPAGTARLAVAVAFAFGYSLFAGWGIPAQRTCWMLAVAAALVGSGRASSIWSAVGLAAAVIVAADPWAPLTAGFWLSFGAVLAIVWACVGERYGETRTGTFIRGALQTQWAASVSLVPLGVWFFGNVSLSGPLANAVAIPLVSIAITPLALLGGALAPYAPVPAGWVLGAAALLLHGLLDGLEWLASLPASFLMLPRPGTPVLLLALAGCAWLLAPRGVPCRAAGLVALLPIAFAPLQRPGPGELWLTALDVGQGSAVVVEAAGRTMVYDTGPPIGPPGVAGSDAGARVIVPYLQARGISRLEALVVSHADADHAGGALSVMQAMPIDRLASSMPHDHPIAQAAPAYRPCLRGEGWQWGDTHFEWLHPSADPDDPAEGGRGRGTGLNRVSCVLRIDAPAGSALLAGDIEAPQERRLLELLPHRLPSDVLLVPHHGSLTSSTETFLDAVSPSLAIFQLAYRSRYGHPHPKVLARYQSRGIGVLRSDHDGAVQVRLRPGQPAMVTRARAEPARYWRVDASVTAPSSPRPSPRRRLAPGRRRASIGRRRARRAARSSRTDRTAASRPAAMRLRPAATGRGP